MKREALKLLNSVATGPLARESDPPVSHSWTVESFPHLFVFTIATSLEDINN